MPDQSLTPPALRYQREQTIQALCEHFARDHLETHELELLIDRAHRATTLPELQQLLQGLPELPPPQLPSTASTGTGYSIAGPDEVRDHQLVLAVMGGNERKGSWTPARQVFAVAWMGGVGLDLREARLDPGVTEIYCFAWMGGIEIIVPPGLHVHSDGVGIMGGFEHAGAERLPVDTSAPTVRITGVALMGAVEITQREPGESASEARKRLRRERQSLRVQREAERARLRSGTTPEP